MAQPTPRSASWRLGPALAVAIAGHALVVAVLAWAGQLTALDVPDTVEAVEMVFAAAAELPVEPPVSVPAPEPPQPEPSVLSSEPPVPPEPLAPEPPPAEPAPPEPVRAEQPPPTPSEPVLPEPVPPLPEPLPAPPRPSPVTPPPLRRPPPRPAAPRPAAAPVVQPAPVPFFPPASPAPLAAPAPAAPRPGIDPAWRGTLNGWLAARRRYPPLAQQREIEGTVGVTFSVDRDGRVDGVAITRPSGSALLDDAVLAMLQGQRVPPFPPSMLQDRASVTVNIRYALDR